jgi:hypothetical protein
MQYVQHALTGKQKNDKKMVVPIISSYMYKTNIRITNRMY